MFEESESEIFERWSSSRALLCFADLGRRSGEDLAIYKKSGPDSRKLKKKEIIVFKYFGNFQSLNHIVKCLLIVAPLACEEVNSRFKTGTPDSQRQQPGEPHRFTMMITHY